MRFKLFSLALLLCAVSAHGASELRLPQLWVGTTGTTLWSSPTVVDLNGDGSAGILAAAQEDVIAMDSAGKELWRWRTRGRFFTFPAVLSRKGETALIYVADTTGLLTCLDGAGKVVWQADLKAEANWSSAVVSDLNHDGAYSVIQIDKGGSVSAFNALTGKLRWKAHVDGASGSPAVGEVLGDGKDEIVVASSRGKLVLLSASGAVIWDRTLSGIDGRWGPSSPVLFGASDGRPRIAAAGSDGRVRCFDSSGSQLWSRETRGAVDSTISVGDMDHDGRADIFAVSEIGVIYRYDEDGRELWNIDMQGRTTAAGALIDLQNDGHLDYVVSTQAGRLMVFDDHARMFFSHQFPNRTIANTPTFANLIPGSTGLQMVITGGESGRMYCFGTPAAIDSPPSSRPWIAYRGDNRKSGAWFGLTGSHAAEMGPEDPSWQHLVTGDPVRFTLQVAETAALPLQASAVCVRPDGSQQSATTPIYGARGILPLPLDLVQPGNYRFTWSVADAHGQRLAGGEHGVTLQPFANDRALIQDALTSLGSAADHVESTLPLTASALRREAVLLDHDAHGLEPLLAALPEAEDVVRQSTLDRTAALVRTARHDAGLAAAAESAKALGPGTSLIAFETTLWDGRGVDAQLPTQAANPLAISRRVVPGQHDPVSVKLLNITDRELHVRVLTEPDTGGPEVALYHSTAVPTSQGRLSWDPLPEVDDTSVIVIPPLTTGEVWLETRFDGVKAGEHTVKVRFQALDGEGVLSALPGKEDIPPPETTAEISYRVLPFAMAPSGDFRMCCWATFKPGVVADLLDHGNNVFCVPPPAPKYDGQSQLAGLDCTATDVLLKQLRGHDIVALVQGEPALKPAMGTPQYAADLKTYLTDLTAHMAEMGLNTDHFAFYPFDEPCGNGWAAVNGLAEFGRQVKATDPRIKIYVDGDNEMPMLQKFAAYTDIWCPGVLSLPSNAPEMQTVRNSGKELWSYDCAYGYTLAMLGNLKDTNIVAEYRTEPLFALRWGARGIGYWSYNVGADPWQRSRDDYPIVYPGRTKPVTSRRWEAVRQGVEDVRILMALRRREADVRDPALKQRIDRLFSVQLPKFTDRSYREMQAGLGRPAFSLSKSEAGLDAFRSEMLDCIEAVCREGTGREALGR